jgi:hypothetical protein
MGFFALEGTQAPLHWAGPAGAQCVNSTYQHRVDDPDRYNFCAVRRSIFESPRIIIFE